MKIIVKYKVEEAFKDKYTKEDITVNTILEISVERMKELNAKNKGRAIDIIVLMEDDEKNQENTKEETNTESNNTESKETKYTKEQLDAMSVNKLKELAENENIELTKARKDEIVEEILEKM